MLLIYSQYRKSVLYLVDFSHVSLVRPQEKEIIEHNSACYVLGRSGTGCVERKTDLLDAKQIAQKNYYNVIQDVEN